MHAAGVGPYGLNPSIHFLAVVCMETVQQFVQRLDRFSDHANIVGGLL